MKKTYNERKLGIYFIVYLFLWGQTIATAQWRRFWRETGREKDNDGQGAGRRVGGGGQRIGGGERVAFSIRNGAARFVENSAAPTSFDSRRLDHRQNWRRIATNNRYRARMSQRA